MDSGFFMLLLLQIQDNSHAPSGGHNVALLRAACYLQLISWNYEHNKMSVTRRINKIFKKFLRVSVQK